MREKLGNLYKISSGGTPSKSNKEYYENGTIKWVKTGDLKQQYLYDTEDCITETGLKKSSARMYQENTVLIAMYGATIGATSILKIPACTNQACAAFPPVENVITEYLYYFLKSKKSQFVKDGVGGAQPNISATYLKNVDFILLDIEEQQKIVNILDKSNKIIEYKKQQLQQLDNLIKSRFVEMFGMPVSNIKGWKTELMSDVAPTVNYTGEFEDDVWLLNLDMVEAQTGRILDYLIVTEDEVGNSTCTFDTSNVLYSKLRPYLNKVVIPKRCGYATSELVPLHPVVSKINREYLAFMLRSDEFVNMINEKVAGAKMPRVSMGDFRKFEVPIPPMDLQEQFADFIQQVDKLKVEVQKSLDEIQLLFDALMQQYFE